MERREEVEERRRSEEVVEGFGDRSAEDDLTEWEFDEDHVKGVLW